MVDDSIKLRQEIMNYDTTINNDRNKLNLLTAEKYNITNINYEQLIKNHKEETILRIKYIILFIIFFSLFNSFLYYKKLIKLDRLLILFLVNIIVNTLLVLYYNFRAATYREFIVKYKNDNTNRLNQIEIEQKNIEDNILQSKQKISNLYKQLQFLTNIK